MSDFALKLHRDDAITPAWITIDEARRRSRLNLQRVRNYALQKYAPLGLAEKRENPQTGQTSWFIREDADPRFAAVRSAAVESKADLALAAELANDPVQREIARSRQGILEDVQRRLDANEQYARRLDRNVVIDRFAAELAERGVKGASARSIRRWLTTWLEGGRDMLALVDKRRVAAGDEEDDNLFEPYFEILRGQYLSMARPRKRGAIDGANALARAAEIPIPHDKMAQRHLLAFEREEPGSVIRYRGGPTEFANKVLPYIPRDRAKMTVRKSDGSTVTREMRSDEIWCADHHVCDTLVEHKGKLIRPWLTAIMDIRSNRIVGRFWSPAAPNKHNVLLAIRDAIARGGNVLPDNWFVDNGKDFDAWMFQGATKMERRRFKVDNDRDRAEGILQILGIKTIHAAPYNARSKPIERFFGIYEENFGKRTWTYCGSSPQNKPECLDERLRGGGGAMAFDDYCADADEWIYRVHHRAKLTSRIDHGRTRDEVYAANRTSGRLCDPAKLELLLMPVEKVKVTRMGVTYRGHHYHDPSLVGHFGTFVSLKVDPADVTSLGVWALDMSRKIAQVTCLDLAAWGAVSDEQVAKVNARIKSIERAVKDVTAQGGVAHAGLAGNKQHQMSVVRRELVEQSAPATPPPSPDALRMVHTPLDGQSNALHDAFGELLKRAAGFSIDLAALGAEGL